jgi:ATP-dependent RNA helicase DDX49/DBP8
MELFSSYAERVSTNDSQYVNRKRNLSSIQQHKDVYEDIRNFQDLGLSKWVCDNIKAIGFKLPTRIQNLCIPAILDGKDVIGCAETGSGKTAAFALPILDHLSRDPYGIFAIVLTPTRELAMQIYEQIAVFGAPFGVKIALIIGGTNILEQAQQLHQKPHFIIGTPGRLRHHIEGSDPPNLNKVQYLVLDEADRLLSSGFSTELRILLSQLNSKTRKTLIFSATMTSSLSELECLAMADAKRFDLTNEHKVPANLAQQYIFVPSQVKLCFLVAVMQSFTKKQSKEVKLFENPLVEELLDEMQTSIKRRRKQNKLTENLFSSWSDAASVIIFVGSCKLCEEVSKLLIEFKIDCVALHSMMNQIKRAENLSKFKSRHCLVLVATDVASRGLDIPSVSLVINFDLPKVISDYIHRVGRTARAGRSGRSLSFVTPNDVELVHAVEKYVGHQMEQSLEVELDDVVKLLNPVSKALKIVQLKLLEEGFDLKLDKQRSRRRKQRRKQLRKKPKDEVTIVA